MPQFRAGEIVKVSVLEKVGAPLSAMPPHIVAVKLRKVEFLYLQDMLPRMPVSVTCQPATVSFILRGGQPVSFGGGIMSMGREMVVDAILEFEEILLPLPPGAWDLEAPFIRHPPLRLP